MYKRQVYHRDYKQSHHDDLKALAGGKPIALGEEMCIRDRGNGIEQDSYDGENIARYGDIVFCSVNHRLGALGFSDLAGAGGEKYRHSGNAGMLDIVAALKWIQANIANFEMCIRDSVRHLQEGILAGGKAQRCRYQ